MCVNHIALHSGFTSRRNVLVLNKHFERKFLKQQHKPIAPNPTSRFGAVTRKQQTTLILESNEKKAVEYEIAKLLVNNTWKERVPPPGVNLISENWVFMSSYRTRAREAIKAKLQTFIAENQSSDRTLPVTYQRQKGQEGTFTILYSQSHIGIPRNHPKVKELEALRKQTAQFQKIRVLLGADIRSRVLFQLTIHNSSLDRCTLIECTIYGSNIKYSHLKDCQVLKNAPGEHDAPSTSCISNCRIDNGTIFDSKISNSICKGIGFPQSCKLENDLLLRTLAFDSTLTSCGVHESELQLCKVIGGYHTKSVIQSRALSLHALPVEIRQMIYFNAIAKEGLATNLIAALRPDSLLYGEVLETLFAEHPFVLEQRNQEAVRSMPKSITQRVAKLVLKTGWAATESTDDVSLYFPPGVPITDIQLEFQGQNVNIRELYTVTNLWFRYFGTVRKFTVVWIVLMKDPSAEPPKALNYCIKVANKRLNKEAVFTKERDCSCPELNSWYSDSISDVLRWTWIAEKGSVLLWNS
ncbi:hypothetical protein LCER1_G002585 [Lachnellula cervina]|uniref:Uncharacterized protein n=1 Tax=Lachnellula cervina TaxID=1316786 RepID=A0A7D8UTK6_9HELO|nr:hypothetical protein LCER1_G002585 [Lachnellula cervina]